MSLASQPLKIAVFGAKIGSSGRTRIRVKAYIQQHAGPRVAPKYMESNGRQANGLQTDCRSSASRERCHNLTTYSLLRSRGFRYRPETEGGHRRLESESSLGQDSRFHQTPLLKNVHLVDAQLRPNLARPQGCAEKRDHGLPPRLHQQVAIVIDSRNPDVGGPAQPTPPVTMVCTCALNFNFPLKV